MPKKGSETSEGLTERPKRVAQQTPLPQSVIPSTGEVGEQVEEDEKLTKDFKDFEEVIRRMIFHENELVNSRMSWLLTLEGFLFAALGFAWEKDDTHCLAVLLAGVGTVVALSAWVMLYCSNRAIARLHDKWRNRRKKEASYRGPGVVGFWARRRSLRLFQPSRVYPLLFVVAWLLIFFTHIGHCLWDFRYGKTAERFILFLPGDKTGYTMVADPGMMRSLQEGRVLVIQGPNASTVPTVATPNDPRLSYPLNSDTGEPAKTAIPGSQ